MKRRSKPNNKIKYTGGELRVENKKDESSVALCFESVIINKNKLIKQFKKKFYN